jgi:nucleoside phosphorylase
VVALALAAGLLAGAGAVDAEARTEAPPCTSRLLVLAAMPSELGPLLDAADVDPTLEKVVDEHRFFVGRLAGKDVVLAMTGIGLNNAEKATRSAFSTFTCPRKPGISGVVFSGVAGGDFIGDVYVPARWTLDGESFMPVNGSMLSTARRVARSGSVALARDVPVGDPACACIEPGLVRPVSLPHQPKIAVGGDGISADPFNGRTLPCIPSGGDVFGCEPCKDQKRDPAHVARFAQGAAPFVDPAFFTGYFENPPVADTRYRATDMETAIVAQVAAEWGAPFIAFRAASDGQGDPLMLPGFPFQFFAYRQVAADNAAAAAVAFLQAWGEPRSRSARAARV